MKKILIVVDMQNDFIDGSLGTPEAEAIVDNVVAKMNTYTKQAFTFAFQKMTSRRAKVSALGPSVPY